MSSIIEDMRYWLLDCANDDDDDEEYIIELEDWQVVKMVKGYHVGGIMGFLNTYPTVR